MKVRQAFRMLVRIYCRYEDDDVTALGAQMTYYLILAFFPFLIVLMSLVGYTRMTATEAMDNLISFLPPNAGELLLDLIDRIVMEHNDAFLSAGTIGALWVSSNGVVALMKGLNKAYDEEETRPYWMVKGIGLLFTLGLLLLLLVSLALLIFGHWLGIQLFGMYRIPVSYDRLWAVIRYTLPLPVLFSVFLCLYKWTPNRRLTFRSVIPGSFFAAVGWVAASLLFSYYVSRFGSYSRTYGSVAGIFVLLVWLYLVSIIILLGAEINAELTFRREGRQRPSCKPFGLRWTSRK
jgi:membrane protein